MKKTFSLITISFLIHKFCFATQLLVPSQHATIQDAINAASAGDTVMVTPNAIYVENIIFMGKDIVVTTPNPATDRYNTIIDGSGAMLSTVRFIDMETNAAQLIGFTIKNGSGTLRSWWYYLGSSIVAGGGILIDSPSAFNQAAPSTGSSPTLNFLIVENNIASMGGGICSWRGCRPIIKNTMVRYNTALELAAGILVIEAFGGSVTPVVLENVAITHNNCTGTIGGGGIVANYTSNVVMKHCTVADNLASAPFGENLFRANGAIFIIYNSIIQTGTADLLYNQGGTLFQSELHNSCVSNFNGPILNIIGNITTPPDFVNQAIGDYHLQASSGCINAGSTVNSVAIDLDSNLRDVKPDMGVFEVTNGAPAIAFGASDTSFCDKNAIDFFDFSTNNPTSWLWTFTGAVPSTSTLQNPTGIYYPSYGQFDVMLVACNANGCDSLTLPAFITEYPLPAAPTITFNNGWLTCSPSYSYQWYLIPNAIPNATQQNYQPTQTGSYYCLISDSNGCNVASNTFVVTNAAIEEFDPADLLTVTVNDGVYSIAIKDVAATQQVVVYNHLTQVIAATKVVQGRAQVDLRNAGQGIYLIDVVTQNAHLVKKIWHRGCD